MKIRITKKALGLAKLPRVSILTPLNLPPWKRPSFADELVFPNDVTQLEPSNISELLGKYTQLYAYARQELSRARMQILTLRMTKEVAERRVLMDRPHLNTIERWRRDTVVQCDEGVTQSSRQIYMQEIICEAAQMYVDNYDKCIAALSRELSRRLKDHYPA